MLRISLLQATYASGPDAVHTRDRWLDLADHPERVEHLFAYDEDDPLSAGQPEIAVVPGLPSLGGRVTAVRNWNSAAERATGDLLMVIADDLVPAAPGWDSQLEALMVDLDPRQVPLVVKVCDGHQPGEHLIRHPVVTRAYYAAHGLFDPVYSGIGADNDLTLKAHSLGLVIDGRSLELRHSHPTLGARRTTSHDRMRMDDELIKGKQLFNQRWPLGRRRILMRYLRPRAGQTRISGPRIMARRLVVQTGRLGGVLPGPLRRSLRRLAAHDRRGAAAERSHDANSRPTASDS